MSTSRQVICAYAKATTWGTAVSVNSANAGFYAIPNNFYAKPEPLPDEAPGFNYHEYIDAGKVVVEPTLTGDLRYTGDFLKMICHIIGDDVAAIVGAGPEYTHTMDVQDETALFGTCCVYDGVTVREAPGFQPTGFTLKGESGGFWTWEVTGIGDRVLVASQTNITLGSVTYRSKVLRVPFGVTQMRINDQSAIALATGDIVRPSSLAISFKRAFVPEHLAQAVNEGSGEFWTRLPAEDGYPVLTVEAEFPEYSAVTYLEDLLPDTTTNTETFKKMDVTMTGPTATNTTYQMVFSFPALRVLDAPSNPAPGGKRIVESLSMQGLLAQSAPAGMTGITKLMRFVARDIVSTAYDA